MCEENNNKVENNLNEEDFKSSNTHQDKAVDFQNERIGNRVEESITKKEEIMTEPLSRSQLSFTNPQLKRMSEQEQHSSNVINYQHDHNNHEYKNREIERPLSKITETPEQYEQSTREVFNNNSNTFWNKQNVISYFSQWGLFIAAFIVYLLIWITGHFSIERITSYYYLNEFNISPYANVEYWKLTNRANNLTSSEVYVKSNTLYESNQLKNAGSIALSLVFSWIMWKFPLTIFTLKAIHHNKKELQILRYTTWGFYLILLLLIDIMVTIFRPEGYQDWTYFIVYFVLSVVLVGLNSFIRRKSRKLLRNMKNYLLPIIYIVIAYVCFSLLIPGIYHSIYNGINEDATYIIVHIFPVIDMIFFSLIVLITYLSDPHTVKFIKMLHFLNTGYAVGHVILFSPEDVEFYYLCVYFVIRNFSFNWIVQKVQRNVIIPAPVPGWIMIYLVSLAINFIPFTGLGRLVISKSFYSQILQLTLPIQSYRLPQDYFAYYSNNLPSMSTFNPSLNTNIQISSVFIIWVLLSITQKYHISKIEGKEFFFYIFGIYLFYFGLTTGIQLFYLQANSL